MLHRQHQIDILETTTAILYGPGIDDSVMQLNSESSEEEIVDFIKNKVKVDISGKDIRDSFNLDIKDKGPLLVELSSFKLRGTGIFISPDLSPRDRQHQSTLVNHLKK
ncbi:hypothetical protein HHI36_011807 [Cryptolaemus montrouzieri]|uniref:Uncharacterized protein n=1 Tax=Cryptolaemus montrouzieri TaxID=559131 RepID=A0ABD2NCS1_9CUCU